jgi:hypothetical protein
MSMNSFVCIIPREVNFSIAYRSFALGAFNVIISQRSTVDGQLFLRAYYLFQ